MENQNEIRNFEGASSDDQDAGNEQRQKKKYDRHTPEQIQELEALFKVTPYPDETQRLDLANKLGLEKRSLVVWFQNKRAQIKMQMERHESMILKKENEKLLAENNLLKEVMNTSILCSNCRGPTATNQISDEVKQLKIENAQLNDELNRMRALASSSPMAQPTPNLGVIGSNVVGGSIEPNDMRNEVLGNLPPTLPVLTSPMGLMTGNEVLPDKSAQPNDMRSGDLGNPQPTLSGITSPMRLMMGNEVLPDKSAQPNDVRNGVLGNLPPTLSGITSPMGLMTSNEVLPNKSAQPSDMRNEVLGNLPPTLPVLTSPMGLMMDNEVLPDKSAQPSDMRNGDLDNPPPTLSGITSPMGLMMGNEVLHDKSVQPNDMRNRVLGNSPPTLYGITSPMGLMMDNESLSDKSIQPNDMSGILGNPPPSFFGITSPMGLMIDNEVLPDKSVLMDLALASMDELIKMAKPDSTLWIKSSNGGKEALNHEEYERIRSPYISPKPVGYVSEASRETRVVIINSLDLVETLIETDRWSKMFPSMVARAIPVEVISSGVNGTKSGTLMKIRGEVQLPSPLVPVREWNILRFCKKCEEEGVWIVVDVSIDINENPPMTYKRLPSGCVVQSISDGLSKVTWVDHSQYDESLVHELYRPLVNSGIGFGAYRWIAALLRQCELLALLMSPPIPFEESLGISQGGRNSMLMLGQRMNTYFLSGVCASSESKWEILHNGNNGTRFMSRKHADNPGETPGNVISATTSVWMPMSREMLFDFLCKCQNRGQWDMISSSGLKKEMIRFTKGHGQGNHVSIFRDYNNKGANGNEANMLWLQDSWTDTSGSMIVYSPITQQSFNEVLNGGDSANVPILASGFAILPDCAGPLIDGRDNNSGGGSSDGGNGCLLTFGLQKVMPVDLQTADSIVEYIDMVDGLISSTIKKIKDAFPIA